MKLKINQGKDMLITGGLIMKKKKSVNMSGRKDSGAVTTQESRCVNFAKNLKLFACFGVLSIFELNC
jgi:hypothetical protein